MLPDTLDIYKNPQSYRLTLCKQTKQVIQMLNGWHELKLDLNLASASELSFTISKYLENKVLNPNYDLINKKNRVVQFERFNDSDGTVVFSKYFIIKDVQEVNDGDNIKKQILCQSYETKLRDKILNSFSGVKKIYRTDAEIAGYTPSELYPTLQDFIDSGILNVLMQDSPSWSVGNVDSEVNSRFRDIKIDSKVWYDFLLNEVQKSYDCIFEFDDENNEINVKQLANVGVNQGLFISKQYLKNFENEVKMEDVVTKLTLKGKDNIGVNSVNLTGNSSITDYSYFKEEMTDSLRNALNAYEALIATKESEFNTLYNNLLTAQNQLAVLNDELQVLEGELSALNATKQAKIRAGEDITDINNQIAAKQVEIDNKNIEINNKQSEIDGINTQISDLANEIKIENNLTNAQLIELDEFTYERNYYDANIDDPQVLLDEGKKALAKVSSPPYYIKIDIVDFMGCVECQHDWAKLNVGDVITVEDETLGNAIELRLIGYSYSRDDNDLQLKISNKIRLNDPSVRLEEIINNSISSTTTLDLNKGAYGDYTQNDKTKLNEYITDKLNLAAQGATAGRNQNIQFGEDGLICANFADPNKKVAILNDMIVLTTDNFNTAEVAISSDGLYAERVFGQLGAFTTLRANQLVLGDAGEKIPNSLGDWVARNVFYNRVLITTDEGIQVFDGLDNERVQVGAIDTTGDLVKDDYGMKVNHTEGDSSIFTSEGINFLYNRPNYIYTSTGSPNSYLFTTLSQAETDGWEFGGTGGISITNNKLRLETTAGSGEDDSEYARVSFFVTEPGNSAELSFRYLINGTTSNGLYATVDGNVEFFASFGTTTQNVNHNATITGLSQGWHVIQFYIATTSGGGYGDIDLLNFEQDFHTKSIASTSIERNRYKTNIIPLSGTCVWNGSIPEGTFESIPPTAIDLPEIVKGKDFEVSIFLTDGNKVELDRIDHTNGVVYVRGENGIKFGLLIGY